MNAPVKPPAATADEVLYEVSEGIATLTINRPEKMNTISGPMLRRLSELLLQANADKDVRVVIRFHGEPATVGPVGVALPPRG